MTKKSRKGSKRGKPYYQKGLHFVSKGYEAAFTPPEFMNGSIRNLFSISDLIKNNLADGVDGRIPKIYKLKILLNVESEAWGSVIPVLIAGEEGAVLSDNVAVDIETTTIDQHINATINTDFEAVELTPLRQLTYLEAGTWKTQFTLDITKYVKRFIQSMNSVESEEPAVWLGLVVQQYVDDGSQDWVTKWSIDAYYDKVPKRGTFLISG